MITELDSRYTSPAGTEFTLAAARFAGITPASSVLDLGCGYGQASCTLAKEFRARIIAIDNEKDNINAAREMAVDENVSHLITFHYNDILALTLDSPEFDLILALGGVLSCVGRKKGLNLASEWLTRRGWFAFSDLIVLGEHVPEEILKIFDNDQYHYESEHSYRKLIQSMGFEVHFMSLVPVSGWDNYYAHMARKLDDTSGFFADQKVKLAIHKEIDLFYRMEGFRYVGYLFGIARKADLI